MMDEQEKRTYLTDSLLGILRQPQNEAMTERECRLLLTPEQRECVPCCTFELIPIRNLVSSQRYQRNLHERHVEKIVADFDVNLLNVVKVSRRDGINYVFDGQHTVEAVANKSGSRDTPVWCQIFSALEYCDEAQIVADQDDHKSRLTTYEHYNAKLEAGQKEQQEINEVLKSFGLVISHRRRPNGIFAVHTLEKIYERYGVEMLHETLNLALMTWDGEQNSLSGNMLTAIALLLHTYGARLHKDIFVRVVGKVPVINVIRRARERRPGALGYAEALVQFYNSNKNKHALSMKALYDIDPDKHKRGLDFFDEVK